MKAVSTAPAGSSLFECMAALALASLLAGPLVGLARSAALSLSLTRAGSTALDAARNRLDLMLAAPCGPVLGCPAGLDCSRSLSPGPGALAVATVTVQSGSYQARLAALLPACEAQP